MEKKLSAINWTAPVPNNGDEGESKPEGRGPEVLLSLLTDAEKAAVAAKNGGLPVLLLDRWGREYPAAKLRLWCSSGSYVLLGKWMDFVRQNELDPGDVIDVYFFRPRFAEEGGAAARVGLVVCSRVHPEEEERRRRDGPEVRKWRCEEKGDQMRKHKRRKC
ncbi:unnamed protein product [Spirodela intermedia]|uniref:Uncharacterized protein n=1 Tax=Spirodela intermedia TaxID=51605 RepID=A0A7I8KWG8_SPIIN|nr:unnamed protein product [Spirodela intermedia]